MTQTKAALHSCGLLCKRYDDLAAAINAPLSVSYRAVDTVFFAETTQAAAAVAVGDRGALAASVARLLFILNGGLVSLDLAVLPALSPGDDHGDDTVKDVLKALTALGAPARASASPPVSNWRLVGQYLWDAGVTRLLDAYLSALAETSSLFQGLEAELRPHFHGGGHPHAHAPPAKRRRPASDADAFSFPLHA